MLGEVGTGDVREVELHGRHWLEPGGPCRLMRQHDGNDLVLDSPPVRPIKSCSQAARPRTKQMFSEAKTGQDGARRGQDGPQSRLFNPSSAFQASSEARLAASGTPVARRLP